MFYKPTNILTNKIRGSWYACENIEYQASFLLSLRPGIKAKLMPLVYNYTCKSNGQRNAPAVRAARCEVTRVPDAFSAAHQ